MSSRRDSITLELPNRAENIATARRAVADFAAEAGADHRAVELAVSEAVTNAIVHGYPNEGEGRVVVDAHLKADTLIVRVRDDGCGIRPNPGGRGLGIGLALIGRLSSGIKIEDHDEGGTVVTMRFELSGGQ
jgi:stage II sporulation protein AB (anti-sigma F factor)